MKYLKCLLTAMVLSLGAPALHAQVIGIGTNPQGSFGYAVGSALASVMQQKAGLATRVQPMSGSSAYTPLLNRGQLEFGLLSSFDVVNAYTGAVDFDRPNSDLRLAGVIYVLPLAMGVANDSPVRTVKDLKGVRVPTEYTAQRNSIFGQDALLATAGLSSKDMKPYPVPDYVKGMQALGAGKVDSAPFGVGSGAAQEANVALASHGGLRFISLDDSPEALAGMRKVFPTAYTMVFQPGSAYPGVIGPTRVMVYSVFLVASSRVPDEIVYKTLKALHDNKPMLEATTATLKTFEPSLMAEANPVPFHPGAEQFYKDIGQWPPKKR